MRKILAWHFCAASPNGRPVLRDGQPLVVGKTYTHAGEIAMCPSIYQLHNGQGGYHASRRISDALVYALGEWACRVECWGDVVEGYDKLVGRNRRALWAVDAATALHRSACDIAEHALLRAGVDDRRVWEAIKTKRRWLIGTATDAELAAAWCAAHGVARCAAHGAAWDSANGAAMGADRDEWCTILEGRVMEARK